MRQNIKYMQITDIELATPHHSDAQESLNEHNHPQRPPVQNKLKGILFLAFLLLTIFGESNYLKYLYVPLFVLMIIISRRNRFDFLLLLFALIITIFTILLHTDTLFYAQFLATSTIYSFDFSRRMIRESLLVWKEIHNLVVTMLFVVILCAYLATSYYKGNEQAVPFFSTFGRSILTFVQALTLDDWAQIGRETDDLFGYLLLCFYILLMTYFYINILMGLLIETLQNDQKGIVPHSDPFNYESTQKQLYHDLLSDRTHFDEFILGKYYEWIVYIITFGGVLITILNNFDAADTSIEKVLEFTDDGLYTIHFVLLIVLRGPIYDLERKSIQMMVLHFVAGPMSLMCTLFLDYELGCMLNMLKMATTPSIRGIFRGTLNMIPMLTPQFTELLGILMFIAAILTNNYFFHQGPKKQMYFSQFWDSVYTMIQIMTLDDWANVIEPMYDKYAVVLPYVLVPLYIFVSNFIILNTLIALSCEYFMEIQYVKIERLDQQLLRSKQAEWSLSKLYGYCKECKHDFRMPTVILNQGDEISNKLKNNQIIEIIYGGKSITVQIAQHSDAL